ncbi:MAG: UDP-glucose 4-epimerase GalE [Clostridia bacterium]|nr:UDP-glucose 4-epimerase GalE [Clostridia bacterium]
MNILVTGGTGYIGSHTCVELIKAGHDVVIVDNLCNSKIEVLDYIKEITGYTCKFYECDILDREGLQKVFTENKIDSVIHFAGLKAVGESCAKPLMYYRNNISGTVILCEVMAEFGVKSIVFSSSATVYGIPKEVPLKEDFPLSTTNPYGSTKLMIEGILKDLYNADNEWDITVLRYFNPIGAHESGLIGEDPNGIPNNLMPYITKVASKQLPCLGVFGNDYPTPDGTGIRDYIHVVDLADGHVKAIDHMDGYQVFNLGTGVGYSVLDLVNAFIKVNGVDVPYEIKDRRPGDIAENFADATRAKEVLGWTAKYGVEDMCRSSWNFTVKALERKSK